MSCEVSVLHRYTWIHWVAKSSSTTAYRWLSRISQPSLRTSWAAVNKSPKLSTRNTAPPMRLLHGALLILVHSQILPLWSSRRHDTTRHKRSLSQSEITIPTQHSKYNNNCTTYPSQPSFLCHCTKNLNWIIAIRLFSQFDISPSSLRNKYSSCW